MDRDLVTRICLVVAVVALYLLAARVDFYPNVVAPVVVVAVAVVMFWPRRTGEQTPSARQELRQIREESKR